jgi:FKBP12-rapamycin complex-associated protein
MALSERTLLSLLSNDPACNQAQPISDKYPQVTFAYMKHLWQGGQKQQAFSLLSQFVMTHQRPLLATAEDEDNTKLLSRYYNIIQCTCMGMPGDGLGERRVLYCNCTVHACSQF